MSSIVEDLMYPDAYPERVGKVSLEQTHISYVFLTDNLVYKIKKPVNFGFLDFSTLEKRKFFCEEEVRLNRRLSPEVYLGVVPVVERDGRLWLHGSGNIVDYAVVMKRLPIDRLMKKLVKDGRFVDEMLERVAKKIAEFHKHAETSPEIEKFGEVVSIKFNTDENFEQTEKYIGTAISKGHFTSIKRYTNSFYEKRVELIERRIREGRIKDCHGDLHMEHICIMDEDIIIFDCIEFNERFRFSDTAADVAFLVMDLDFYGRKDLSEKMTKYYVTYSGDSNLENILGFYKMYRAYVRGKVNCFKLEDPSISEAEKNEAILTANKYFKLAYSCIPKLILVCGYIGTGKSSFAREISKRTNVKVISSDVVRKELAGVSTNEHRYEDFRSGIYSPDFSRRTYNELLRIAREYLGKGRSVILDATFSKRKGRMAAKEIAQEEGAMFLCVEVICSDEIIKSRMDKRMEDGSDVSDGRWEIFPEHKKSFEKVEEFPDEEHFIVDTSKDMVDGLEKVLEFIGF